MGIEIRTLPRQLYQPVEEYLAVFPTRPYCVIFAAFFQKTPYCALSYFSLYLDYQYPRRDRQFPKALSGSSRELES
jgi:hypothetical protein